MSKTKADRTYKMVLDRYPSSVKLMRSYGRFLEEVKNDPWTAARYYRWGVPAWTWGMV